VFILSAIASLTAYLLNWRPKDVSAKSKLRLKDYWLRELNRWGAYRKQKEAASDLFKRLVDIATIIAAFALTPSLRKSFDYGGDLWHQAITNYPYKVVKVAAIIILAGLAFSLFLFRKYFRRSYAFLEIAVGLAMAWDALGFVDPSDLAANNPNLDWSGMTGRLLSSNGLKVL